MKMLRVNLSRPELAVLLGVALIVGSAAASGVAAARRNRRQRAVRAELGALIEAGRRFFMEYGTWPTAHSGEFGDYRYGRQLPNAEVLNVLRALDGPGNSDHTVNTRKIVFFEPEPWRAGASGCDADGELMDPWGQRYQIVVDTDLDGHCAIEYSIYGRRAGRGMVAWSCGPDRISDTSDDILSWEQAVVEGPGAKGR